MEHPTKWCVRCCQPGHLSHACKWPICPVPTPRLPPDEERDAMDNRDEGDDV